MMSCALEWLQLAGLGILFYFVFVVVEWWSVGWISKVAGKEGVAAHFYGCIKYKMYDVPRGVSMKPRGNINSLFSDSSVFSAFT